MDISKTSSTYRRYIAADSSYAQFFDTWISDRDNVGFCSMMRTIYFWGPSLAIVRVLMMVTTFAILFGAFYVKSTEIIAGIVVFSLLIAFILLAKMVVLAGGDYFDSGEKPLLFKWAKASHDKICPLVTFTEEEEATCEE